MRASSVKLHFAKSFILAFSIAAACTTPIPSALAQPTVAMDSAVFIERAQPDNSRSLVPASRLSRGDRVITVLTWYRMGGDGGFTITNPLPRAIAYQSSARDNQEVSVDGGRSWGTLGDLRIGPRLATPEDVTHVRWRVQPGLAAQGRGQIAFSGIVR
jgi:hypothetical protein